MRTIQFSFWLVAFAFILLPKSALATSIVYDNTTTDTFDTLVYAANDFTEIGDQIHLDGTDRLAVRATVQFFNFGSAGAFDATLRFFSVGTPVGGQIGGDFVLTNISAPVQNSFDVIFSLSSLFLPNDLIFTVAIANQTAGVDILGLNLFQPPTIGSSDGTFAIAKKAGTYTQAGTADENLFFQLQADPQGVAPVPEPLTFLTLASGLAVAARARSKQRNRRR